MTTALVKVSLLLQYLRVYKSGPWRTTCIVLLVVVSLWGLAYSFMMWFPCFPVRAYWDWSVESNCYGYGVKTPAPFARMWYGHVSLNMLFDTIIVSLATPIYFRPGLSKREMFGIAGLFSMGAA